ncbi:MAG: ParB N-terminal domain-containing protein [Geobacteraceae bacterium]|nr:ParB N-terminal domain-containing protein [Geobacteraceae bacterium]
MNKLENIDISLIDLDVSNPRIAKFVEFYNEVTDEAIKMALQVTSSGDGAGSGNSSTYTSLRESIRTQKGIINPIILVCKEGGRYLVIEGNTRLSIYQDFKHQGVDGEWGKIPAIVYDKLDEKNIDAIRLQAHLVGPRDWDAYSKAKYLNHLRNCEHLTINEIIDFCGGKKPEILKYIDAYNDMETYYRPILGSDDQFDISRFSAFVELQQKPVKDAIIASGFTLTDFSKWVHKELLKPLNTVRSLKSILSHEKAREVFLKKGAKEALKLLDQASIPDLNAYSLEQLAKAFYNKISQLTYPEVKDMRQNPDCERARILFDLKDEVIDLCDDISRDL